MLDNVSVGFLLNSLPFLFVEIAIREVEECTLGFLLIICNKINKDFATFDFRDHSILFQTMEVHSWPTFFRSVKSKDQEFSSLFATVNQIRSSVVELLVLFC